MSQLDLFDLPVVWVVTYYDRPKERIRTRTTDWGEVYAALRLRLNKPAWWPAQRMDPVFGFRQESACNDGEHKVDDEGPDAADQKPH